MTDLRIVIVEDEYYVRKGIINSFPWKDMGCEIVGEAANGAKGLEVIQATQPDLCIVDIEMPVMDGLEMVSRLKKMHCQQEFIFLTAHQQFTYVHSALKLEVVDYLLKPFSREDLENCLHKVKLKLRKETDPVRIAGSVQEARSMQADLQELNAHNEYIKRAIDFVRQHYSEDISTIVVSQHLELSDAYFCRLFKKETGYTFIQYLSNYRVHIAAGLLANFDLKISEVAEQVGINDSNYFCVIFKKIMGVSPKEYQTNKHN